MGTPQIQGILLAAVASLCFGINAIFVRLGLQHIRPSVGTLISVLASLCVILAITLIVEPQALFSIALTALGWFAIIGLLNYVVARQSNFNATKRIGAAKASGIMASAQLFAMVLAVVFLGETLNTLIILGTISIVIGLFLLVSSE